MAMRFTAGDCASADTTESLGLGKKPLQTHPINRKMTDSLAVQGRPVRFATTAAAIVAAEDLARHDKSVPTNGHQHHSGDVISAPSEDCGEPVSG